MIVLIPPAIMGRMEGTCCACGAPSPDRSESANAVLCLRADEGIGPYEIGPAMPRMNIPSNGLLSVRGENNAQYLLRQHAGRHL